MSIKQMITFRRCAILFAAATFIFTASPVRASSWQGIEPFKSRRDDVLKILGTPISESQSGPLTFKVMGGTASISFVDQNFVRTKRLRPELEGTVLQIILQHENSDRKSTRLNSSHRCISYAVFCLKKKKRKTHD